MFYVAVNKTEIVDDITHQSIGDNQMCVFIMSDAGVIRWKVDNCTQQKIVLCQNCKLIYNKADLKNSLTSIQ